MNPKLEHAVKGAIGTEKYKVTIEWRNGVLVADEPVAVGGKDLGPDPYTLLLSSLAACTLSTLRMYIARKEWDIPAITVELNLYQETSGALTTTISRDIRFTPPVTEEQKERLLQIAQKCPVSKILENKIILNTTA